MSAWTWSVSGWGGTLGRGVAEVALQELASIRQKCEPAAGLVTAGDSRNFWFSFRVGWIVFSVTESGKSVFLMSHLKDQSVSIGPDLRDGSDHLELRVQTLEGENSFKVFQEALLPLGSFCSKPIPAQLSQSFSEY